MLEINYIFFSFLSTIRIQQQYILSLWSNYDFDWYHRNFLTIQNLHKVEVRRV